jgi:hypothetical protein
LKSEEFKNPNLAEKIREEADTAIEQSFDNSKDVSEGFRFHITLGFFGLGLFASIGLEIYAQMHGQNVPLIKDLGMVSLGVLAGLVVIPKRQHRYGKV